MRQHGLLVGMGDVDAGKALPFRMREKVGKAHRVVGRAPRVEEGVAIVLPERAPFGLVKSRRLRELDVGADEADPDNLRGVTLVGHAGVLLARRDVAGQSALGAMALEERASPTPAPRAIAGYCTVNGMFGIEAGNSGTGTFIHLA